MDYPIGFADQLRPHLRALRKAHGLTQSALAGKLGVGQSRIAEIEANPSTVSLEQLLRLLAALEVQVVLRDRLPAPTPAPRRSATRHGSGPTGW